MKNPTAYMAQSLGFGKGSLKVVPATGARTDKSQKREPKKLGGVVGNEVNKLKP